MGKFGFVTRAALLVAATWSAAAFAGETPLYQPAPAWVQVVDIAAAARKPGAQPVVLGAKGAGA
jgi:hypothetical protein